MIFKVLTVDAVMTSTGKPMKKLSLEEVMDSANKNVYQVNIFSDFPHYADVVVGYTIDGELRKNDKGYTNLYSNEIKQRGGASGGFKTAQIEKVMETKRQDISKFQDNKEHSIKLASTLRMAVDLAIAEGDNRLETTFQETIRKWREWLWLEWENDKNYPPF